jgi:hypothetical protein
MGNINNLPLADVISESPAQRVGYVRTKEGKVYVSDGKTWTEAKLTGTSAKK